MTELEVDLVGRQANGQRLVAVGQQTVEFKHRLARQDQLVPAVERFAVERHAGEGQAVAIGGHGAQLATIDQQQQAVEVVAHVLRGHRELRLRQEVTELALGDGDRFEVGFDRRHAREVFRRQGLQREPALAGAHQQALVFEVERDFGAVRQRAQDVLQLARPHRHRAVAVALGAVGRRGDLDFDVGRQQGQLFALFLEQDVGEDRQRMPFLDDARNRLQRRQQRITVGFNKNHIYEVLY